MNNKSIILGTVFTLLSALCYSGQTAFVKSYVFNIPMLAFLQSLISLVLLSPLLILKYKFGFLNLSEFSQVKKLHLLRTIFSMGISYSLFIALTKGSYFNAMLLYNLFPVIAPILSYFILKQYIRKLSLLFIIIAFIGAALTLNLATGIISVSSCFAIISAFCTAASITMIKKISTHDNSIKSIYFYFLMSTVISGLVALFFMQDIHFSFAIIAPLIAIGALFFAVQYLLVLGTVYANPTIVSVTYYSNIVFSFILSAVFFHDHLSVKIILGMLLIFIGGVSVVLIQMSNKIIPAKEATE